MSDFVAYFGSAEPALVPDAFGPIARALRDRLDAERVDSRVVAGAALLTTTAAGRSTRFAVKPDGTGWIAAKGRLVDVRTRDGHVDLLDLLDLFLDEKTEALNRYEGAFAAVAWDAVTRRGWAVNDQASLMNLYYVADGGGLYVATTALALARALRLALDPDSVREFLARGALLTPASMFRTMRRLDVGEHLVCARGSVQIGRHWSAYAPTTPYRTTVDAAAAAGETLVDRMTRCAGGDRVITDLTGGLDTRTILSAICASGHRPAVTVNGPAELDDVRVARQVADRLGLDMRYFDTPSFWTREVDAGLRRDLVHRTGGELPFTSVYHLALSRPLLARDHGLHVFGCGGGFLRYFPWGQEFLGIGRRRRANIDNLLRYRVFYEPLSASVVAADIIAPVASRMRARLTAICDEEPDTLTTQQLDAVHVWKMTAHSSLYLSAGYNWLPTVAPLLTAGVIRVAVGMPWRLRLTSQLQRRVIAHLCPAAARLPTNYGGTAEPTGVRNLHGAAWRTAKRGGFLAAKLDRVLLNGAVARRLSSRVAAPTARVPFITDELRAFLRPERMWSRHLYADGPLDALVNTPEPSPSRTAWIARIATVETLCRELDVRPEPGFLS